MNKYSFLAVTLLLAGCAKNIQNADAVKQGVVDYLNQRSKDTGLNMAAMEVSVSTLSFEKDVARAKVEFHPKGMPQGAGMTMNYLLDRRGDKWVVKSREGGPGIIGAPPAGGEAPAGQLPPGHPPAGAAGGALPPGHPPAGGAGAPGQIPSGLLPPGHPPTGAGSKQ